LNLIEISSQVINNQKYLFISISQKFYFLYLIFLFFLFASLIILIPPKFFIFTKTNITLSILSLLSIIAAFLFSNTFFQINIEKNSKSITIISKMLYGFKTYYSIDNIKDVLIESTIFSNFLLFKSPTKIHKIAIDLSLQDIRTIRNSILNFLKSDI